MGIQQDVNRRDIAGIDIDQNDHHLYCLVMTNGLPWTITIEIKKGKIDLTRSIIYTIPIKEIPGRNLVWLNR